MQQPTKLPQISGDMLFSLEDITYTPEAPRLKEPFTVKGKVELFGLLFLAPVWVQAKVTYPESWWEEIIPIIGGPTISEGATVFGGNFEIKFPKGFDREGEFILEVAVYLGPTYSLDSIVLPPFPPIASEKTTFIVAGEVPEEELGFSLTRPTISLASPVSPGTVIKIMCPVTSESTESYNITVKCIIYEGSLMPGHGAKLAQYTSPATAIAPGETKTFNFSHTTVAGTIDRRDVEVEVYVGGQMVKDSEWDDVYYVKAPEEVIDFDLTQPTASPSQAKPGDTVKIIFNVTSKCTKQQSITIKVLIYEGSIYATHGTLLTTKTADFIISPGITATVDSFYDIAVAGTIDRRDVGVQIYVSGDLIKEGEWDDVYYVVEEVLETLQVKIDPAGSGYVTTDPAPSGGIQHNWQFPRGTTVYVTAHPYAGYAFDRWSGEMTDTTKITAPVYPMTEHRLITAHFKEAAYEAPTVETLPATSIGGDSADLNGRLVSAGSHDEARCHFEWGKTTSYGSKTTYIYLHSGQEFTAKLTGLQPNTTYHFRAVAHTTLGDDYGVDRTFKTVSIVTPGFQLRVINAPAGATQWRAVCGAGGALPYMPVLQPLYYIWEWGELVPETVNDLSITAAGPWEDGYAPTIARYQFPFQLRNGKKYVFDFGAYYSGIPDLALMMKEE